MKREDSKVNMKVCFGNAKTIGEIVKCNPKKAQVKILEKRGRGRGSDVGSVWNVPYEMMEPLPANGDKNAVKITGGQPKVDIIPGVTTFRYGYADGNPLWKVLKSCGRGVYLCEVQSEPIEINGIILDGDWVGTQKVFMEREIVGSKSLTDLFQGLADEHEQFYESLTEGQIVHYQNGFDNWVRCKAVREGNEMKLKPIALVGAWKKHDLPYRREDGSVYNGYYADKILKGETFKPNASNLFENGCEPRNGIGPNTLPPLSLELPPMTVEQENMAKLWQQVAEIQTTMEGNDPAEIIRKVKELVNS